MPQYLVRYFSETAIELGRVLEFHLGNDTSVIVRDSITRDDQEVPTQFGFRIEVKRSAIDVDEAIAETRAIAEGAVSIIAFSLSAVSKPCTPELVLEITPDKADRELLQYIPLPSRIRPSRKFRPEEFGVLWDHLDRLSPEPQGRIYRAIRWYRKALFETDPFDQFVNLWTGLEVINELIKQKHGLPLEQPIRTCPSCGTAVVVQPTLAGVEHAILTLGQQPKATWRKLTKVRNGLLHGFGSLNTLNGDMRQLVPALQNALLSSVLDLLDIRKEHRSGFIRVPLRDVARPFARSLALIHDLDVEGVLSGQNDVRLEIVKSDLSTRLGDNDVKHETNTFTLRLIGHSGSWTPKWIEVAAEKDPEDAAATIQLKTE